MREKAAWSQSVRDDPSRLSLDEFLAFRHPESSHATIIAIVEETLGRLGKIFVYNKINIFFSCSLSNSFNHKQN